MKRFLVTLATCTVFALPATCNLQGHLNDQPVDLNYTAEYPPEDPSDTEVVVDFLRDLLDEYGG